ncbi:hypothetical protein EON62_01790, partial [archaeon]
VDDGLRLVAWNKRYAELFGFPPGLLRVGLPIAEASAWALREVSGIERAQDALQRRLDHMRAGTSQQPAKHHRLGGHRASVERRGWGAATLCTAAAACVMLAGTLHGAHAQSVITTVAGGGIGDGGRATSALLGYPTGVAAMHNASTGSVVLYIADNNHNRIRRVSEDGIITTVAGTGTSGFSGDGGPATAAQLWSPYCATAVANASSSGGVVLYIADSSNHRIRRVSEDGVIATLAGDGTAKFGGDGGLATTTSLNSPFGVAVVTNASSGGVVLYIADTGNIRVRRVGEDGIITTVAGTGVSGFSGNGGPATAAQLQGPYAVSTVVNAASGGVVLFIADAIGNRIRRVDEGGNITTVAGTGSSSFNGDGGLATAGFLSWPCGVVAEVNASSGATVLYIADHFNRRVRRVDVGGNIITVAGNGAAGFSGDGGAATEASVWNPFAVAVVTNASSGGPVLYIADHYNQRIRRVSEDGVIATVAGGGAGDGGPATAAALNTPSDVAAVVNASNGGVTLYIPEYGTHRIRRVDEAGIITTVAGNGTFGFGGDGGPATVGMAAVVNASGSGGTVLYISDYVDHRIRRVDTAGIITTVAGNGTQSFSGDDGPATAAALNSPFGVAAAVNEGNSGVMLFIADSGNHRIRRVDAAGVITTVAGSGTPGFSADGGPATTAMLNNPRDMIAVVNASSGGVVLYISDWGNARIRRVAEDGIITTVAGSATSGYSGDGGPATAARLTGPFGVAVATDAHSTDVVLYIVDSGNKCIRRMEEGI